MQFYRDDIIQIIDDGIAGKSIYAPIGFNKMQAGGVRIFPASYTIIGGFPGSGKSAFLHEAYIHNPYSWWKDLKDKGETDIELYWILYSMERPFLELKLKWIARKIFQDTIKTKNPILLDVEFLKGFKASKVTEEIKELVYKTFDYFEEMFSYIEVYSSTNPTGVYTQVKEYALKVGKITETPYTTKDGIQKTRKVYSKNNPKRITIIAQDHLGKLRGEKVEDTFYKPESRELIARMSMYNSVEFRDHYGMSPVSVIQFNRNIENTARFGNDTIIPQPSDFKNASNPYEDCDTALALFNPFKLGLNSFPKEGYDLRKMVMPTGENRFRALTVLKNSYGVDDCTYGLVFLGENGKFSELPKATEMTEEHYKSISNIKKYE